LGITLLLKLLGRPEASGFRSSSRWSSLLHSADAKTRKFIPTNQGMFRIVQ